MRKPKGGIWSQRMEMAVTDVWNRYKGNQYFFINKNTINNQKPKICLSCLLIFLVNQNQES